MVTECEAILELDRAKEEAANALTSAFCRVVSFLSLTRLSVQVMWLSTIATRLAWLEEILQSRLQSLHTFGCSIWFLGQP